MRIEVEIAIEKAGITPAGECRGKVNAKPVVLNGQRYKEFQVAFAGFIGRRFDDGLYHGRYAFDTDPADGADAVDFADYLDMGGA